MASDTQPVPAVDSGLPEPGVAFQWAREAMRDRDWIQAMQRWAVLRAAYPQQPAPWIQGAVAHIEADQLPQAAYLLSEACRRFPNNPNAIIQSAELAMREGQWDRAETLLARARSQFPDQARVWLSSSSCAERQGNTESALQYNQTAREKFPDCPDAHVQYAEMAMSAGQWRTALERWETIRSRFPDTAPAYQRAAEAARQMNRHQEARRLVLAHQYGTDVFDEAAPQYNTTPSSRQRRKRPLQLLELVWTKALFNLRSEVHRNYLSYAWWLIEPLLHMAVYYAVFGILLQRGGPDYPVFLLTGLIPWMWFSKAVSASSGSILRGQQLMIQAGLPAIVFPLVSVIQTTVKQLPAFALLAVFVWLLGFAPGYHWLALMPVVALQLLMIAAVACAVAAVIPFVRDFSYLVPTGLMFLMFCSGVFYDYRIVAPQWQDLFLLNPAAYLLKCYREILVEGVAPDMQALAWWAVGAGLVCVLTALAYQRLRYVYPRIVME